MGTSLMAYLGLDASNFQAGLRNAQNVTKEAGTSIASSLGGMATGAIAGFGMAGLIHSAIESAEHIRMLSNEFRVSTDTIQTWDKGAKKANLTAEDIGNALNRLKKSRESATSSGDSGGFAAFGISLYDLNDAALSTEQIMDRMRQSVSGKPITDEQDVVGMELMGKSGAKILSAMQEINKMGPVHLISREDIDQLHEYNHTLEEIHKNAVIATAKGAGFLGKASGILGANFEMFKNMLSGTQSFKDIGKTWGQTVAGILDPSADTQEHPASKSAGRVISSISGTKADQKHAAIIQKETVSLEAERDKLAQKILENQQKAMTIGERQLSLKKEIAEHERNAELAMRIGNEHLSIAERMKAEEARGRLKQDHKVEHMDFTSAEKIGAFSNVSALHSAGMDHAAKTARNTETAAKFLADIARAVTSHYTLDEKNNRAKNTMELAEGMQRVRF